MPPTLQLLRLHSTDYLAPTILPCSFPPPCPSPFQPLDDAERSLFTKQAQAFVEPGFKLVMKEKVGGWDVG